MTDQPVATQKTVAGVRFHRVGKLYHFDYSEYPDLQIGDYVIVETARGRQMGEVMSFNAIDEDIRDYKPIMRMASPRDLILKHHWELQQDSAIELCRQKAAELGGLNDVKFVAAVYNYDGSLLTFLYTAEDKVNVSRLWNDLTRILPAQIDMRQIGPRDVAKLLGGYGACGELRCCSTFLTDFSPISIKMAKAQGISLNPSEITGMCGRLRCCLVYEYEQYVEARQKLPKKNKRVGTPYGEAKVIDVLPLQDAVLVYVEEQGVQTVKREELVPLEELEALAKKAKEPCTVHGDEGCDCGAKPPKAKAAGETAVADEPDVEGEAPTIPTIPQAPRQLQITQSGTRERRERMERPKRGEAGNRPERGERKDRPPRKEQVEGQARPERGTRKDRPEKSDKPDQPPRKERPPRRERNAGGGQPRPKTEGEQQAPRTGEAGAEGRRNDRRRKRNVRRPRPESGGGESQGGAAGTGGDGGSGE